MWCPIAVGDRIAVGGPDRRTVKIHIRIALRVACRPSESLRLSAWLTLMGGATLQACTLQERRCLETDFRDSFKDSDWQNLIYRINLEIEFMN